MSRKIGTLKSVPEGPTLKPNEPTLRVLPAAKPKRAERRRVSILDHGGSRDPSENQTPAVSDCDALLEVSPDRPAKLQRAVSFRSADTLLPYPLARGAPATLLTPKEEGHLKRKATHTPSDSSSGEEGSMDGMDIDEKEVPFFQDSDPNDPDRLKASFKLSKDLFLLRRIGGVPGHRCDRYLCITFDKDATAIGYLTPDPCTGILAGDGFCPVCDHGFDDLNSAFREFELPLVLRSSGFNLGDAESMGYDVCDLHPPADS